MVVSVGLLALVTAMLLSPAGPPRGPAVAFEERFAAPGPDGLPPGWRLVTFRRISRPTAYEVVRDQGQGALKATSDRAAAAIVRPVSADPRKFPRLSWRWRIDQPLPAINQRSKAGDDYAARVYVTFEDRGEGRSLSERMRSALFKRLYGADVPAASINYVWASGSTRGDRYRSPYTERSAIIVLRDATDGTGVWRAESRDLVDDYLEVFGAAPPPLTGVAIMTDADDTELTAIAHYADLVLASAHDPRSGSFGHEEAHDGLVPHEGNLPCCSCPRAACGWRPSPEVRSRSTPATGLPGRYGDASASFRGAGRGDGRAILEKRQCPASSGGILSGRAAPAGRVLSCEAGVRGVAAVSSDVRERPSARFTLTARRTRVYGGGGAASGDGQGWGAERAAHGSTPNPGMMRAR